MATKTLISSSSSSPRTARSAANGSSEVLLQGDTVSICLLVNRRHEHLRVIDFRAGPTAAKRGAILAAARREGIEKVFTLVERDEVGTWLRLGFTREGTIPGFYRRSDASIMGIVVSTARPLSASTVLGDDDDELAEEVPASAAALLAERTIARARRSLRDDAADLPGVKLMKVSDADAKKACAAAQKKGAGLTGLEPFGRDAVRSTYACASRGATTYVSAEAQPFFHNSFLELVASPRTDGERVAATAAIFAVTERLRAEGTTSTFAVGPADDALHAAVFVANGFRRSGALASHLLIGGERRDAIVWSKKLVQVD